MALSLTEAVATLSHPLLAATSAESVRLNGNASINGNVISNDELVTNGSNNVINGSASTATADLKGTINGSLNVGAGDSIPDRQW